MTVSGIAGIAGVALSQVGNVSPNLGQLYIVDSFMVVVLGGVGNVIGAVVGALGLGVLNKFLEPVAGAVLGKIIVLVLMGLLAALVVPRVGDILGKNKVRATQVQIEMLAGAVERFNLDVGRYPTQAEGLESLVARPQDVEPDTWDGSQGWLGAGLCVFV